MATGTLTGQTIANTYKSLLKITGTTAGGETLHATTLKIIEDGDGNPTPIQLAQNRIEIVPTANHANAFEVSQADGTQILNINSTTPSVLVGGSGVKLYFSDAGGEYISGDGTDLTITSGRHIVLALGSAGSVYHTGDGGTSNTIYGKDAGVALASGGNHNVLIGEDAGKAVSTGDRNTVIGYTAGDAFDTEADNTLIGYDAGGGASYAGVENTFIGSEVGGAVTTSQGSVAIGYHAIGAGVMTGDVNVAIGYASGQQIVAGAGNTFVGGSSGLGLTAGTNNVAIGNNAFDAATVGESYNIAIGKDAMGAWDEGHEGGSAQVDHNIAIGYQAFLGGDCGASSEVAVGNIAIGAYALDATSADDKTGSVAIGYSALTANTSGEGNTAVGYLSLSKITTGGFNTCLGYNTLSDTDGSNGIQGRYNVHIGYNSGGGDHGNGLHQYNTVVGASSMTGVCDSAGHNSLFGYAAGAQITSGDENTIIGSAAGGGIEGGSNNTFVGYNAVVDDAARSDSILIGKDLTTYAGNSYARIGNDSNYVQLNFSTGSQTWVATSDERIKQNIEDGDLGLEFINKLRAIKYEDKPSSEYPEELKSKIKEESLKTESDGIRKEGFIAQEVKKVADDLGTTFSGWQGHPTDTSEKQMLGYDMFVVPLVKAVQELSQQVEELKAKIN